jgi:uncharacterized membrane protein
MGVIAALVSAVTSSAKDLVSKSLAARVAPDLSTFASFVFALPFYGAIYLGLALYGGESVGFSSTFLVLVVLRGLSDVIAEGCKMRALESGDVSLVSGLLSLSPLTLVVVSPIVTGDPVHLHEFVGIVLMVLGSVVVVKRDKQTGRIQQKKAVLYALAGSLAFAMNSALDRLAVSHAGPLASAFSVTLCAAIFTAPALWKVPRSTAQLSAHQRSFLVRGLFETVFMVAKMAALVTLPAHIVVGLTRISLLLTVIVGGTLFQEEDRLRRLCGAVLMYVGLVVLLYPLA